MSYFSSCTMLIGRILISFLFIWSGITKLVAFHETLPIFEALSVFQGLDPQVHSWIAISYCVIQIIGGLLILFGFFARFGALILILLMIPATIIFHNFWTLSGPEMIVQRGAFIHNFAIIGGLFYVLAVGAGRCGCDRKKVCETKDEKAK